VDTSQASLPSTPIDPNAAHSSNASNAEESSGTQNLANSFDEPADNIKDLSAELFSY
jgi:hypothetical protein